ncbi:hypothetical protein GA0111570_102162 [Raineyella antarctica]|uniref:Uncharacterized protein n=1 Tax=Raineyella antarctica TaxID=1577474 RepID=A0A1G6GED2_9ACTN|nr:ankyrin repeat domain-containing protein [Raineyella antarctica]SDB80372.1 hypothetical protein GA0111570_102162 [Raineyella antarctica]
MASDDIFDLAREGEVRAVVALLEAGADLESATEQGSTLLALAASYGNVHLVSVLIKRGAKVNTVDEHGRTPLSAAIYRGEEMVARLLLDSGADPHLGSPNAIETAEECGMQRVFTEDQQLNDDLRDELRDADGISYREHRD